MNILFINSLILLQNHINAFIRVLEEERDPHVIFSFREEAETNMYLFRENHSKTK